jgi:hypothetical protein
VCENKIILRFLKLFYFLFLNYNALVNKLLENIYYPDIIQMDNLHPNIFHLDNLRLNIFHLENIWKYNLKISI